MMNSRLDNPFTEAEIAECYCRHSDNYHNRPNAFEAFTGLVPPKSRVFEIGVGTGAFTELLLSFGYDVRGIDESEEMLRRASEQVRTLSERCNLSDYDSSGKYDVVVSHSGGFTFKRGKFETYYQSKDDLERAFQKVYDVLNDKRAFLVNKGEHGCDVDLGDRATLSIAQEEGGSSRTYTFSFKHDSKEITRRQRRLALAPEELQEMSSQYFNWNFDDGLWMIGGRKHD